MQRFSDSLFYLAEQLQESFFRFKIGFCAAISFKLHYVEIRAIIGISAAFGLTIPGFAIIGRAEYLFAPAVIDMYLVRIALPPDLVLAEGVVMERIEEIILLIIVWGKYIHQRIRVERVVGCDLNKCFR